MDVMEFDHVKFLGGLLVGCAGSLFTFQGLAVFFNRA
jgi:hypothetical protein